MNPSQIPPEIVILVPTIAGLFALLGAFWGSRLARKGEHEKWQRENRSETFAKFLEMLTQARSTVTDLLYDNSLEELPKNITITETYLPVEEYARIVCLYLPSENRKPFRALVREIAALHSFRDLGDKRISIMEEKLEEIQTLFEGCL